MRRNKESVVSVGDNASDARQFGRDHGPAASHPFEQHHSERLATGLAWQYDHRGRSVSARQFVGRELPGKNGPRAEPEVLGESFILRPQIPFTDEES